MEGLDRDTWYIFEKVAITKDLYTGGGRTFLNNEDAREFRGLIYQQYGEREGGARAVKRVAGPCQSMRGTTQAARTGALLKGK